jgi:hypothetical protein
MNQRERDELINKIGKEWIDKGLLIEAGFQAMRVMTIPPSASPEQVHDMRMAFFGGAQHLFGTIMNILDPGSEPTDADLRRMDQIDAELKKFIVQFAKETMPVKGNA